MTRIKRPAAALSATVLLAFSLSACGGPPTDASEDEFCEVVLEEPGDDVDAVHDWADKLEETGTPEDIPDDARNGFELLVDFAKDVDEDDIDNFEEGDFSDDEQKDFAAYSEYLTETCFGDLEIPEDPSATE